MAEESEGERGVEDISQISDLDTGPSDDETQGEEHELFFKIGCVCGICR